MHRFSIQLCTLLLLFSQTCIAQHDQWPNWLGKDFRGVSTESDWSTDFPKDELKVVWEKQIGIGFSSISIADGQVYSMGFVDDQESVFCLNQSNGETIWTHTYPSKLVANLYEGGPGSTPTIDGDRVYTLGKAGQLFCLGAKDGEVLWQRDLQKDLGVSLPQWGFNSSARILGDQLFLEGGRVVSYDKNTGKLNWKTEKHLPGYGSAALLQDGDRTLVVTLDSEAVRVLDSSDGTEIDAYPWLSPFQTNSTTPIVDGDTVFVSTAYQVGCGLFRFDGKKLNLLYDNRDMRNHFNNSILHRGKLYGFDGNSNFGRVKDLVCLDHSSGEVEWRKSGLGVGSLMIADDRLIILSEDGELVIAKATADEFKELARARILQGRCWTVPVLLTGRVYARNARGRLVAVQLPTQ